MILIEVLDIHFHPNYSCDHRTTSTDSEHLLKYLYIAILKKKTDKIKRELHRISARCLLHAKISEAFGQVLQSPVPDHRYYPNM